MRLALGPRIGILISRAPVLTYIEDGAWHGVITSCLHTVYFKSPVKAASYDILLKLNRHCNCRFVTSPGGADSMFENITSLCLLRQPPLHKIYPPITQSNQFTSLGKKKRELHRVIAIGSQLIAATILRRFQR